MSNQNNKVIFSITVGDLQHEAINEIDRKLTDNELYTAKKGVESGLLFGIETVIKTAIKETVDNRKTKYQ